LIEHRKHWTKVFWAISGNDKVQYDSLRRSDYIEFWDILDEYESKIERERRK